DVDHAGQRGVLPAEDGGDQVELRKANQAPVDAADDHEHEGDDVDGFHGMSTLSMTWMTPLLAAMSALTTRAPSTITPLPALRMSTASPLTVVAVAMPETSAAA